MAAMWLWCIVLSTLSVWLQFVSEIPTCRPFFLYLFLFLFLFLLLFLSRQLSADRRASVSHVALQPNMAVVLRRRGEEFRGRHVAKVNVAVMVTSSNWDSIKHFGMLMTQWTTVEWQPFHSFYQILRFDYSWYFEMWRWRKSVGQSSS